MRQPITRQLGSAFKGVLIGPEHPLYRDASAVWNAMIEKRPGLVVRCSSRYHPENLYRINYNITPIKSSVRGPGFG